jgi:hypothetical protein
MTDAALLGTAAALVASSFLSSMSVSIANVAKNRRTIPVNTASQPPRASKETPKVTTLPNSKMPSSEAQGSSAPGDPSLPGATEPMPPVVAYPVTDQTKVYTVRSTYYGPDKIHGEKGGNDNIFEHTPASQYTATQLKAIGNYFCAMSEKFMRKGFMGAIIRVTGTKKTLDMVVVDLLPDRNDGKNVEIDVHDQSVWEALGGDVAIGMSTLKFHVVGKAKIPVPNNSPWAPQHFNF